jgi:hypothetical protein
MDFSAGKWFHRDYYTYLRRGYRFAGWKGLWLIATSTERRAHDVMYSDGTPYGEGSRK